MIKVAHLTELRQICRTCGKAVTCSWPSLDDRSMGSVLIRLINSDMFAIMLPYNLIVWISRHYEIATKQGHVTELLFFSTDSWIRVSSNIIRELDCSVTLLSLPEDPLSRLPTVRLPPDPLFVALSLCGTCMQTLQSDTFSQVLIPPWLSSMQDGRNWCGFLAHPNRQADKTHLWLRQTIKQTRNWETISTLLKPYREPDRSEVDGLSIQRLST